MIREIKMPNLGTTTTELTIIRWLKNVGELVQRGDPLLEVETDKATMEVESYLKGYLKKIVYSDHATVSAGDVIAYIGEKDDEFIESAAVEPSAAEQSTVSPKTDQINDIKEPATKHIKVSPVIRALAESKGIDLNKVRGSGPHGLILRKDLMDYNGNTSPEPSPPPKAEEPSSVAPDNIEPFTKNERATANVMSASKSAIPHVYFSIDVEAESMMLCRLRYGVSYNAFIAYSVSKCLKKFPYLAAQYHETGRIIPSEFNISIAMANGNDLYVPVIRHTDSLFNVEKDIQELKALVQTKKLTQNHLTGGVFTITNLGSFGLTSFSAVINPPQAAILAIAGIRYEAVPTKDGISFRHQFNMTLSIDHRIANGTYAAGFLKALKTDLERTDQNE